jgi:F-type H+-transporting ATPase subunit alpha
MELLKQPQYSPYPLHHEVMLIYAGTRGYLDSIPVEQVGEWKRQFVRYMDTAHPDVGRPIQERGAWNDEIEMGLQQAIKDFNASWTAP